MGADLRLKTNNYEVIADPTGAYVLVELTQGQWCQVDIDDWFGGLDSFKWCATLYKSNRSFYACGWIRKSNKLKLMHRLILGASDQSVRVDHKNHNTLCNRRFNIRFSTASQNTSNKNGKSRNNTSGYTGVSFSKVMKKWESYVWLNRSKIKVGYFDDAIEAAKARDKKAITLHGEFASLNFPGVSP